MRDRRYPVLPDQTLDTSKIATQAGSRWKNRVLGRGDRSSGSTSCKVKGDPDVRGPLPRRHRRVRHLYAERHRRVSRPTTTSPQTRGPFLSPCGPAPGGTRPSSARPAGTRSWRPCSSGRSTSTPWSSIRSPYSSSAHLRRLRRPSGSEPGRQLSVTPTAGRTWPGASTAYNLIWYPAPEQLRGHQRRPRQRLRAVGELPVHDQWHPWGPAAPHHGGIFVAQFGEIDDTTTSARPGSLPPLARPGRTSGSRIPPTTSWWRAHRGQLPRDDPLSTIVVKPGPVHAGGDHRFVRALRSGAQGRHPAVRPRGTPCPEPRRHRGDRTPNAKMRTFYATYPVQHRPRRPTTTRTSGTSPASAPCCRTTSIRYHELDRGVLGRRACALLCCWACPCHLRRLPPPALHGHPHDVARGCRASGAAVFFAGVGFGFIFFEDHPHAAAQPLPRVSHLRP